MIEGEVMNSYRVKCVLPELEKLKRFFEDLDKDKDPDDIVGLFGNQGVFFGNVVQYNNFVIPCEAMRLIYKHNKSMINKKIADLRNLKNSTNI